MAKRLKKVIIPKKVVAEAFAAVKAAENIVSITPIAPVAPPEPSEWAKRVQERVTAVRIKQAQWKAERAPKIEPPMPWRSITSETVIAGKSVKEWHDQIESLSERAKEVVDLTHLPDWVTWANAAWIMNGKPTPSTKVLAEVTELREEAEQLLKFAGMDKDKAKNQSEKKARKLLEAAEKKSTKAAELFKKATALAEEHMKK